MTTTMKEMAANSKQQCEEVSILQSDIVKLKTENNAMKDEIKQLTSLLGKMTINNENQKEKIDFQSSTNETIQDENKQLKTEVEQLKTEVQQLKVSHMNSLYVFHKHFCCIHQTKFL